MQACARRRRFNLRQRSARYARNTRKWDRANERDVCRRSGGRVYAAGGVEITPETEAQYDKKVLRVRFKAN